MEHVFKPQGSDFLFVISSVPDAALRFRAQACLDTGSSFTLIMPRRKIAQMGLKCLGPTTPVPVVANCATCACQLYLYKAVEVSCPDLAKSATMLVYGVSLQQVYGSDQPPETGRKRKSTVELTPKKVTLTSTATEQLQTLPQRRTTRNSFSISPCKLDEGATGAGEPGFGARLSAVQGEACQGFASGEDTPQTWGPVSIAAPPEEEETLRGAPRCGERSWDEGEGLEPCAHAWRQARKGRGVDFRESK
eukprot:3933938-Rhodomonas_salina.2